MTTCFSLPDCFLACKTTQELPVTQLARHVDLFHLVIADNWRSETLSLPHGLAPPIKPTTQFSQAEPESDSPVVWTNKPFLSTRGMVFIWQYLISGAETWERLQDAPAWDCSLGLHVLPSPKPRLLNGPHVPLDCGFRNLLPCWLFHPSLAFLFHCSPPDLLLSSGLLVLSFSCLRSHRHRARHASYPRLGCPPLSTGTPG
jgi:hypothetical protein